LTYAIAAGNDNSDVVTDGATPARVVAALTIGASTLSSGGTFIYSDLRASFSNFGNRVDLFAPGDLIRSASNTSDTASNPGSGTSEAAPHVAGAVALYLEGRTAASGCDCFSLYNSKVPNNMLPASSYAKLSTCPDRIAQFMKSNATLSDLDASTIGAGSPNRLLNTSSLSAPTNPIDNQRFFVWQHYADFLAKSTPSPAPTPDSCDPNNPYTGLISQEPDENGLNYWTSNITGCGVIGGCPQYNPAPTGCGTGFNDNNSCTAGKRIDVSRAFWVAVYPSWFNTSYGLTNFDPTPYATPNEKWLDECYWVYLRRRPPHDDLGFQYWLGLLNSSQYGNPANQDGVNFIIEAFIESLEYRQRSGQP